MVLPGKSGVEVPGIIRGIEISTPGSLPPGDQSNSQLWCVSTEDLDINGHVNNAMYLDHAEGLIQNTEVTPKEFSVCYLAETLLGQEITLHWNLSGDGVLSVDGTRVRLDGSGKPERVFAAKLCYSVNRLEL